MTTPKTKLAGIALIAALCAGFTLGLTAPAGAGFDEAVAALQRGDYATAFRELRPLAERGNGEAQYNLGIMYRNGRGVPQDNATAGGWFRKADEQGVDTGECKISLDAPAVEDLTVYYYLYGKAYDTSDYESTSGEVTILKGQDTATFTITPIDDSEAEASETVIAELVPLPDYYVDEFAFLATVTIADNDTPIVSAKENDAPAASPKLNPCRGASRNYARRGGIFRRNHRHRCCGGRLIRVLRRRGGSR